MRKRLSAPTGILADQNSPKPGDTDEKVVRSAILVHSGPEGSENTLSSSDGDIEFSSDRIQLVVQKHNEMIAALALEYGGFDKMPIGAYPPLLDQHADDSNDRIRGRVVGLLRYEVRDVPKVGKNVACAMCDGMTFLGADTVKQVLDGRVFHLSVGIDEETNTLGEVSTVIEPAAPGAMVLSKKRLGQKAKKKNLKGAKKMTVKLAKLKALQGELKQLGAKAKDGKKRIELAKRKTEVASRFTKLMADKKMTPAEFKKLDIVRLAKLQKEDLESVMHVYEGRESLIKTGQQGSTAAASFTDVGSKEDREVKRLKAAVKKSMKLSGTKFKAEDDEDEKHLEADDEKDDKKKLSEKAGDKKELEAGDENSSDIGEGAGDQTDADTKDVDDVMKMVEENTAQIARVASMVDAIIDELHGDAADDEDDGDDSEDESSDEDKSEASESDDSEDKKPKGDK